ncbi:peptidylprolyl isomerase [Marinomonas agarivorans]|nr:peptidylprolyl isomerase [Marinomonas agarivorans]
MNKSISILLIALVLPNVQALAATKIDGLVAIIDNHPILESDIRTRFQIIKDRVPGGVLTGEVRKQILNQMIDESLQVNYANRLGIRVNDQELNNAVLDVAKGLNTNLAGLKSALAKQGIEYERYLEQIKNEILTGKLKAQILRQRAAITEQEINDFLNSKEALANNKDQVHLRHILLRKSPTKDIKQQITQIKNSIQTEQDFIKQATESSEDSSALKGGDIGWRPLNQLPSLFIQVLQSDEGPLFGPIESNAGQHLLWLVDKKVPDGNFQQQTKVRHILLSESVIRNNAQTKIAAERIYQRLLNGADFAALAKEFSDDSGSALRGGDLNWVTLGQMVPEFEKTMQATKIGQLSKPFKSQFGWHILRVDDRRSEDISDAIKRANAERTLIGQKQYTILDQWLSELKSQAFIDIK